MSDLISRQDAIDAICKACSIGDDYTECLERRQESTFCDEIVALRKLPSAELIRCEACKWWDKDDGSPYGYCLAMKHGYITANWEIGIYRRYKGDFYCADAERKEEIEEEEDE